MKKLHNPKTNIERLAEEIANYTVNWFTHHTLKQDRLFGEWYLKRKK